MTSAQTITIFCSVLNEFKNLEIFLEAHAWADEIVVFDSGSTDGSIELCKSYGCVVIPNDLSGNHNQRTAIGIARAKSNWIVK